MKQQGFIGMLLSSILGGIVVAIVFLSLDKDVSTQYGTQDPAEIALTNYIFDSTDFVVPEGLNFVFAAKSATPSVVHIKTSYGTGTSKPGGYSLEDFFRSPNADRSRPNPGGQAAGSGVIITADGYIVTNNHVIEDASEIEVLLNDNRSYPAEIVGTDPSTDLAVIRIDESNLNAIDIGNSADIQIGEWVLAIGNPFEFRSTVTAGIVSAKGRNINILSGQYRLESFIQTDAAVNPGNSGGALVNLNGELVGINTAIASPTGAFAGYSFAIPATLVEKVVDDLIEFGTVQRALLGISIRDVDSDLAREFDLDPLQGVYVQEVNFNSAAMEAGLEVGDVIVAIDDIRVNTVAELQEQVAINRPGDRIKVTYVRDGVTNEAYATLKNNYGTTNVIEANNDFRSEGALFEELTGEVGEKLDVSNGIVIADLEDGVWMEAGIEEGFIITRVDKSPVGALEEFIEMINEMRGEGLLIAGYYPDGTKALYAVDW